MSRESSRIFNRSFTDSSSNYTDCLSLSKHSGVDPSIANSKLASDSCKLSRVQEMMDNLQDSLWECNTKAVR